MGTNPFGFDDEPEPTPDASGGTSGPFGHLPSSPETPEPDEDLGPSPLELGAQVARPEAAEAPRDEVAQAPTAPTQAPATPPVPESDWTSRYVGEGLKYPDARAFEQAYDHALALQDRNAIRAREAEDRAVELESYLQQMAAALRTAPPAPTTPAGPEPLDPRIVAAAEQVGLDPQALPLIQHLAAQEAERRTGAVRADLEQQRYAQAAQAQAQAQAQAEAQGAGVVGAFRAAHPEVAPGTEMDSLVASVMTDLDLELGPETLEIAFEAATNPAFWQELRFNPNLIDTDEGLERARQLAQPGTPASAAPGQATPARSVHVESGGSGLAPQAEADEWAVLALARDERQRVRSPLGI